MTDLELFYEQTEFLHRVLNKFIELSKVAPDLRNSHVYKVKVEGVVREAEELTSGNFVAGKIHDLHTKIDIAAALCNGLAMDLEDFGEEQVFEELINIKKILDGEKVYKLELPNIQGFEPIDYRVPKFGDIVLRKKNGKWKVYCVDSDEKYKEPLIIMSKMKDK